jgi:hypothetical protein
MRISRPDRHISQPRGPSLRTTSMMRSGLLITSTNGVPDGWQPRQSVDTPSAAPWQQCPLTCQPLGSPSIFASGGISAAPSTTIYSSRFTKPSQERTGSGWRRPSQACPPPLQCPVRPLPSVLHPSLSARTANKSTRKTRCCLSAEQPGEARANGAAASPSDADRSWSRTTLHVRLRSGADDRRTPPVEARTFP